MEMLQSIRYCHACDDLSGDTTVADESLLYGPLRSSQDVHRIGEYVRNLQRSGVKNTVILDGKWQLMAGGFPITFPSGSYCTPVCITKSIPFPEDAQMFQREVTEIARNAPEGPLLHVVFLE